ncbi:MAG: acetyl-CoA carboxylase biotin carboxyl carrier protein subunit [Calditrichaeota bacterium]|nr:acetyl-CoA carboxylase biotin carboxyl carrier protein subunit [Calditrichota bacterium]
MEKYYSTINDNEYSFQFTNHADSIEIRDASNQLIEANFRQIDQFRYSLLLNNQSYIINFSKNRDKVDITIRGKKFVFEVDTEKSRQWKQILAASESDNQGGEIKSPMPGMVIQVLVKEGQEIKKGDSLLILSAMKMENELKAEFSGTISKILARDGVAVEKNQLLLIVD